MCFVCVWVQKTFLQVTNSRCDSLLIFRRFSRITMWWLQKGMREELLLPFPWPNYMIFFILRFFIHISSFLCGEIDVLLLIHSGEENFLVFCQIKFELKCNIKFTRDLPRISMDKFFTRMFTLNVMLWHFTRLIIL